MARSTTSSSNSSQTQSSDKDPSVSDLNKQVDALKNDIKGMADILASLGIQTKDQAQAKVSSTARDLRAQGEAHLRDAKSQAEDLSAHAAQAVRQQPMQAVGIAVGIGFLIGYITSRR